MPGGTDFCVPAFRTSSSFIHSLLLIGLWSVQDRGFYYKILLSTENVCFSLCCLIYLDRFKSHLEEFLRQLVQRDIFVFPCIAVEILFFLRILKKFVLQTFPDRWAFPGGRASLRGLIPALFADGFKNKALFFFFFLPCCCVCSHPMHDEIRESSHPLPVSLFFLSRWWAIPEPSTENRSLSI